MKIGKIHINKFLLLLFFVFFILLLKQGWNYLEFRHYAKYLPPEVGQVSNNFVGSKIGGYLEGCGVAIFNLSDEFLNTIGENGLRSLSNAKRSRDGKRNYLPWRETPAEEVGSVLWFVTDTEDVTGPNCVDLPKTIKEKLKKSIQLSGNYFSKVNDSSETIIFSREKIIVFAHYR
jgi:hypothetical protein